METTWLVMATLAVSIALAVPDGCAIPCGASADCPSGEVCTSGFCVVRRACTGTCPVACRSDSDCGPSGRCASDRVCAPYNDCAHSADCATGEVCRSVHACADSTAPVTSPQGNTCVLFASLGDGKVACDVDGDCGPSGKCIEHVCMPYNQCDDSSTCATDEVCAGATTASTTTCGYLNGRCEATAICAATGCTLLCEDDDDCPSRRCEYGVCHTALADSLPARR